MSVRDEFMTLATDLGLDEPLTDATELVASSRLDSLAMFRLALWAEERTGQQLDPTAFDPAVEWATVGKFLAFVDSVRRAGAPRRTDGPASEVTLGNRDYRIVEYERGVKRAVAAFQVGLWGRDQATNERYLEWKYELNPFGAGSRIYLAFCGDELVGMRGFYGSLWEAGQPTERFPMLVADDLLVHEGHRNTGLFNHLMHFAVHDLARAGHRHLLNLTANEANLAGSLSTGWRAVKRIHSLHRESATRKFWRGLRHAVARSPVAWRWADSDLLYASSEREAFARLDRYAAPTDSGGGLRIEARTDAPVDEMAALVAALPHDGRIRHVRTAEYLRWRFANPFADYRFVLARDRHGALAAYAVLHRHAHAGWVIAISDLEARDVTTASALLQNLLRRGQPAEILAWRGALPNGCEAAVVRQGFSDAAATIPEGRANRRILVKFTGEEPESSALGDRLLDESGWDIRMLYSMRG